MNQNPNNPEYNPYAQSPSGPNYPPTPDSRYGGQPAQNPNSGPVSSPGYDAYNPPPPPITGPGASNPYNNYAPPPPPLGGNSTQYGAYDPTYVSPVVPPPPPTTPDYPPPPTYQQPAYQPPTYAPQVPVPPTPPNRPGRGRAVIISVIALLVIVGASIIGVVAVHNNQVADQNAKSTATAGTATSVAQAQATGTAQSYATATAIASTYPFFAHLAVNDPMTSNSNKQVGWQTDSTCSFAGNTYQVVNTDKNTYATCMGLLTNYTNFTFQVDATLKEGDADAGLGLYFRANQDKHQGYLFYVDQSGYYSLWVSTDGTAANSRDLKDSQVTTSQYTTGLYQKNTLAVVMRDSQIAIYINQQLIVTSQDTTYTGGQIGLIAVDGKTKVLAAFSNVKIWTAA
ncbi:MAG TPA: hypothetical protein VHD63_10710 [Ktedonobacteraceae bacterium]|nr:hypothetical protein [Ktedonobacteraceae bacterium]